MAAPKLKIALYNPDPSQKRDIDKLNQMKKYIVALLKREMFDPMLTSYAFNLTPYGSLREVLVKFYNVNSRFYLGNDLQPEREPELSLDQVANYILRYDAEAYQGLVKFYGDVPQRWTHLNLFHYMLTHINSKQRIEDFSAVYGKKALLLANNRCQHIEFVTGTGRDIIDTVGVNIRSDLMFTVMIDTSLAEGEQLVALCRGSVRKFSAPSETSVRLGGALQYINLSTMELQRVMVVPSNGPGGFIISNDGKGYCRKLCGAVATECASTKIQLVSIHSISISSHLCYIRSFLTPQKYTHALFVLHDAVALRYSLTDHSRIDTWLLGNNSNLPTNLNTPPSEELKNLTIGTNLYSKFFADTGILERYCQTHEFLDGYEQAISCLDVLCEDNSDVDKAIDHFITYEKQATMGMRAWRPNRSVFRIHSHIEYRKHLQSELDRFYATLASTQGPQIPQTFSPIMSMEDLEHLDDMGDIIMDMGDSEYPLQRTKE
jgi:hypothetical protein